MPQGADTGGVCGEGQNQPPGQSEQEYPSLGHGPSTFQGAAVAIPAAGLVSKGGEVVGPCEGVYSSGVIGA
jgi:hypothetical protein